MLDVSVQLPIHLAVIEFPRVHVESSIAAPAAGDQLEACAARYRNSFPPGAPRTPGGVPGVEPARTLFRALGIDPTRRRPSSESLLRRALQDRPMPRINNLVDAGNWCSLDFLLPLGLYDAKSIDGAIVMRKGDSSDSYRAISNREINLADRYLLADAIGPFGSPMTDSVRTAVTANTTSAAVLLYAPHEYDVSRLRVHGEVMAARITEFCGGEGEVGVFVASGP